MLAELLAAGIGAAANIYGANKSQGAGGQGGVATTVMPQYSWTEPTQRLTADYVSQNIQRMGEGQFPQWYSKLAPQVRQGLQKSNYETYFGTPGWRTGVVNEAVSGGAGQGIGAQAAVKRKQKALTEYADRASKIDQFMAAQGIDLMTNQSTDWARIAANLPQGPNAQVSQYGSQNPGYTSPWSTLGGTIMSNIPWENMFSSGAPEPVSQPGWAYNP